MDMGFEAWPEFAPDEILPRLWQGGTEDDDVLGLPTHSGHYDGNNFPFDVVVTLYADAQPAPWGVEEFRFGFPDSGLSDFAATKAIRLARIAHTRWTAGERVLIRCQAGVNRSGLVMALVLMLEGFTADEAVQHIRQCRSPFVLSNRNFEHWLRTRAADQLKLTSPSSQVA